MPKNETINTTHLPVDHYERRGTIHRDYIAHCLRWSHAIRMIRPLKNAFVLDVGCADFALARTLWTNMVHARLFVGIDFRDMSAKIPKTDYFNIEFVRGTAVETLPRIAETYGMPDVVVSFEMIEHIERSAAVETLRSIRVIMHPRTLFLLSTPCFNGSKANNHVYEWTYSELRDELRAQGFLIQAHFGTFASQVDLEKVMGPAERELYKKLSRYYEPSLLSTILAPLFPQASRNALWELRRNDVINGTEHST
jgi:2-polyprenyl-3-methyl-5-hydroxy-6-metoxy-1,4-benzoquinol methylase